MGVATLVCTAESAITVFNSEVKKNRDNKVSHSDFSTTACFDKNILLSAYTETAIFKVNERQEVEVNYMYTFSYYCAEH